MWTGNFYPVSYVFTLLQGTGHFVKDTLRLLFFCSCALILLTSCMFQSGIDNSDEMPAQILPLSCIAVLPANTSADLDATVSYAQAQALEKGAAYATDMMDRELRGNPKVRIINSFQVDSLVSDVSGGISGTVAALGQKLKCDGVLLTTVSRYQQREGTEYSVDAPAAVDFSMVLRHSEKGNILWSADFREEQESLLSNLFSFSKAQKRGFKWVTAEQLMEQGIKERLGDCPYLQ
jgi:hypothetical protein